MKTNCSRKCGSAEGERLKADAHRLLEARREIYLRRGRRALLRVMLDGNGRATADDVREAVELPADLDPRFLGAVPGRLAYDRIIGPAGFTRSARPERHASWLQVWELVDRQAAEVWLATHPDLPDPGAVDQSPRTQSVLFPLIPTNEPGAAVAAAAPVVEN